MVKKQDPVLKSLETGWYKRAQIKTAQPFESILFEKDKWDFLPQLMPFHKHPLWNEVSVATKQMAASYGWIMYNMRTVCIETKVVSPLCYSIIGNINPLTAQFDFKSIISQTLIDESYHTLLSINGIKAIYENRTLEEIKLPEQNFYKQYEDYMLACSHQWQKDIVQLSLVVASEVLISDYLSLIATSETIQPFCREIVRTHLKDELAHSNTFKIIAEKVMTVATVEQKEFMLECIVKSLEWFSNNELETWQAILTSLDVPRVVEIIEDYRRVSKQDGNKLAKKKIYELINHLKNTKYSNDSYTKPILQSIHF